MPRALYNECDPYAAAWLRNLIAEGLIPDGEVDERSIADLQPADLEGYAQVHLFAGIGGWPLAARLAGWPDDGRLWTGSPPCQPWSAAGPGAGPADARHLWPEALRLIQQCRPGAFLAEQVPVAAARGWLDGVCDDLEGLGYACGAAVAPAGSVGAKHLRGRLWVVAYTDRPRFPLPERTVLRRARRRAARRAAAEPDWWTAESGLGRIAHGVPGRVGALRALGNAIVPQAGAIVIGALIDCLLASAPA